MVRVVQESLVNYLHMTLISAILGFPPCLENRETGKT